MLRTVAHLVGVILLGGCATMGPPNDRWTGQDKAKHFVASASIAAATTAVVNRQDPDTHRDLPIAVGVTLSFGVGKEAYDLNVGGTGWSWKDLAWDLLGALTGYAIVEGMD
jgi:putative lipoprotein